MNQPTDHRVEAVTDLDAAFSHMIDLGQDDPDAKWRMIGSALIGIGHALLAQPPMSIMTKQDLAQALAGGPDHCQTCGKPPDHDNHMPGMKSTYHPNAPADTDTRCDLVSRFRGQCLDHQHHTGPHQWPAI